MDPRHEGLKVGDVVVIEVNGEELEVVVSLLSYGANIYDVPGGRYRNYHPHGVDPSRPLEYYELLPGSYRGTGRTAPVPECPPIEF